MHCTEEVVEEAGGAVLETMMIGMTGHRGETLVAVMTTGMTGQVAGSETTVKNVDSEVNIVIPIQGV